MNTLTKTLAGIVAMASLAAAEEQAAKPDIIDTLLAAGEESQAKAEGTRAGEEREFEIAPGVKMAFRWCPAGGFVMGSPASEEGRDADEDQAKVTLSKGFWMAKTEVTQAQWEAVMGNNPANPKVPNYPVVGVSWNDAQKFMETINAKLGNADGGKMALPTEAQYEYAARAGETGLFPGGNQDEVAWHDGNANNTMHPVGTKKANAWGMHDMSGNAWEWVQDCYDSELWGGTDPVAVEWDTNRVIRGGCIIKDAANCRLATRSYRAPTAKFCGSIGFRVVRNGETQAATKAVIDPEIKGQNVTRITCRGPSRERSFAQTGPDRWMSGETAYNEVRRDGFSVYLQQADAENAKVQIDLFHKHVFFRGNGPKQTYSISGASKEPADSAKAAGKTTNGD